jgi:hypothetical protein
MDFGFHRREGKGPARKMDKRNARAFSLAYPSKVLLPLITFLAGGSPFDPHLVRP